MWFFFVIVEITTSIPSYIKYDQANLMLQTLIQFDSVMLGLFGAISAAIITRGNGKKSEKYIMMHLVLILVMVGLFLYTISRAFVDMAKLSGTNSTGVLQTNPAFFGQGLPSSEFISILVLTIAGAIAFLVSIILVEYASLERGEKVFA